MTNAKDLFKSGQLSASIEELNREVKANPTDSNLRIFLFELLCFAGDYERAEKQLEVVGHQSSEMRIGTEIYRQVLAAEKVRRKVITEGTLPSFLTTPPEYTALHLEAFSLAGERQPQKARVLLEKSLAMQPVLSGTVDGKAFEGFEDSDLFWGPFAELILGDRYTWLPFAEIRRLQIHKPAHLRDLIWTTATIEAREGDLGEVFLPVLYPGTSEHPNEAVKLGRLTEWLDIGEGLTRGAGQRLFSIDGEDRAMLEATEIIFDATA